MFKTNAENHDYNTRNAFNFEYPNNKLNFCDKSICYQGVKTWNHHHPSAAEQATTRFLHAQRSSANAAICCSCIAPPSSPSNLCT